MDTLETGKTFEAETEIRHSTFTCTFCAAGTEKFSDLFSHGNCKKCGGAAGAIIETSTPAEKEVIRRSVLIVCSDEDRDVAYKIMDELVKDGVNVVDPMGLKGKKVCVF